MLKRYLSSAYCFEIRGDRYYYTFSAIAQKLLELVELSSDLSKFMCDYNFEYCFLWHYGLDYCVRIIIELKVDAF